MGRVSMKGTLQLPQRRRARESRMMVSLTTFIFPGGPLFSAVNDRLNGVAPGRKETRLLLNPSNDTALFNARFAAGKKAISGEQFTRRASDSSSLRVLAKLGTK